MEHEDEDQAKGTEEGGADKPKLWTDEKVKLLISTYREHKDRFKHHKKFTVWNEIAFKMACPDVTGAVAERKFRNLRQTYKTVKDRRTGSGNVSSWVWYEDFDSLFRRDAVRNHGGMIEVGASGRTEVPVIRMEVEEVAEGQGRRKRTRRNEEYLTELEERHIAATERMLTIIETFQRQQQEKIDLERKRLNAS